MNKYLLTIFLSILFSLLSPSLVLAACPTALNDNDVTIVNGNTCTIPGNTTYILDKVSSETSSTNTAQLSLTGGSLTISNTATLRTATLVPNGGSVIVQTGGTIIIGGTTGTGVWVSDGDADGYAADFTIYTATAAGRRRLGLMKSKTVVDCYNTNINANPGSSYCSTTNRGDGSYDYNCSSTSTTCGTTFNLSYSVVPVANTCPSSCGGNYSQGVYDVVATNCGGFGYTACNTYESFARSCGNSKPAGGCQIGNSISNCVGAGSGGYQACQ